MYTDTMNGFTHYAH